MLAVGNRTWRPFGRALLLLSTALWWSSSCVFGELTTDNLCGFLDHADSACDACSANSCCEEERACRDSAACAALYECLDPCGQDVACIEDCAGQHPGDEAGVALLSCRTTACLPECLSCGNIPTESVASCDTCLRRTCCSEQLACADDAGCIEIAECALSCGTPGCDGACIASGTEAEADESRALFNAAVFCTVTGCQADCSYGTDFECVDGFDYPIAEASSAEVPLRLVDLIRTPIPGMTVRACEAIDTTCEDPVATGTTDEEGDVTLTVPVRGVGFDGYFSASKPGVLDALFYYGYPIPSSVTRVAMLALPSAQIPDVESLLNGTNDPTRGHVFATIIDCVGQLAIDIELDAGSAADEASIPYYFNGPLPSTTLTATTGDGVGGFVNLLPGLVTISGKRADTGEVVVSQVVEIRPSTLTSVQLVPPGR